jgi:quercetin dioxygenase-like cupin family protein
MTRGRAKRRTSRDTGALAPATAFRMKGLVGYSAGSIVSRTIEKTRVGTMTLFAFDASQELSEHSAPYDAFVHVLDGEAELTIGGKPVKAHAGELVVMPADIPHAVKARKRFKMLLTMLRAPRT